VKILKITPNALAVKDWHPFYEELDWSKSIAIANTKVRRFRLRIADQLPKSDFALVFLNRRGTGPVILSAGSFLRLWQLESMTRNGPYWIRNVIRLSNRKW